MVRVIVVGGGFAGCAAAISAAKAGAKTTLIERTDMLLSGGIRAGRMNYNGKIVAAEECKALGVGEIFQGLESIKLHEGNILEEEHVYIYDCGKVESVVHSIVEKARVEIRFQSRAIGVKKDGSNHLSAVVLDKGETIAGDAFVDATGTAGGMALCQRYGKGCVMCIYLKCPVFGDRVSIATKAGAPEYHTVRENGTPGNVGAAVTLFKDSLSPKLRTQLKKKGALTIPLPEELIDRNKLKEIGAARTLKQMENINLVDIGPVAKCVGLGYFPIESFRKLPGFENAQIEDPIGGSKFNAIRGLSLTPRDDALCVEGFTNLFCAGEKAGPLGGVAECISLGHLAGYNAARVAAGLKPLTLPRTTAIGDYIAITGERMRKEKKLQGNSSFGHGSFFERMKQRKLYTTSSAQIRRRMEKAGVAGILAQRVTK